MNTKQMLMFVIFAGSLGCSASRDYRPVEPVFQSKLPNVPVKPATSSVQTVGFQNIADTPTKAAPVSVDEFVKLAIQRNPRLGKAIFAIDASQGKFVQAGLYPNPTLAVQGDELGDVTGPGGIWSAPHLSQEIVTGKKLRLSQAIAATEVNQATLSLLAERYAIVGTVRGAFYDLYSLERRIKVLDELAKLAKDAVTNGKTLFDKEQIAKLDYIQLEFELERYRAKAEAARRELPGAQKRLAAAIGDPRMTITTIDGPFEEIPKYDADRALELVMASHPEIRIAKVGVERAQAAVRRAEAEPIPNLTVTSGFTRQNQNKSNDWMLGVSAPLPLWNRNQGNIRTAMAEVGVAVQDVSRVENELAERVAMALRSYAGATQEATLYKSEIIPRAEETYKLSVEAFKGGQFEYLRVIQAQRSVAESRLEYNRALGDAWKAAAELSSLLLEEEWTGLPLAKPK